MDAWEHRSNGDDKAALAALDEADRIWCVTAGEGPTRRQRGRPIGSKLNEEGAVRLMDFISESEGIRWAETLAKRVVAQAPDLLKGSGTSTAHVKRLAAKWKARKPKKK